MNLTKERKMYGGVLVVAVAALGIDWMSGGMSGPATADAADPAALLVGGGGGGSGPAAAGAAAPAVKPAERAELVGGETAAVARRLRAKAAEKHAEIGRLADVFHPQAGGVNEDAGDAESAAGNTSTLDPAASQFAAKHRLTAVMLVGKKSAGSQGGYAILDGDYVATGKAIDGFKLVGLDSRGAVFNGPGGEVVRLTVAGANPQ